MRIVVKNFEKLEYNNACFKKWEYTYPLPPPFLERGIVELIFRRAAYVPLSKIKPSRSSILCRECYYSAVGAVLTALIVMTVAGSMSLSGFFFSG